MRIATGGPFIPYLFLFCIKGISSFHKNGENGGALSLIVFQQFFAADSILFAKASLQVSSSYHGYTF